MSLLVVGSVALDTVKTPFGTIKEGLGGSATYFATAASFFTDVQLVAVIGEDFPEEHINFLKERKIDLAGLERNMGQTFRWKGEYGYQLNEAKTLQTDLNVFESFRPKLPVSYTKAPYLFLGNIDPRLQFDVMNQVIGPKVAKDIPEKCDKPNFYLGDTLDTPQEKALWVVEVPRPPRADEKRFLPKEELAAWPVVPVFATGQKVVVDGKWSMRSPRGFVNSDGLLVYANLAVVP